MTTDSLAAESERIKAVMQSRLDARMAEIRARSSDSSLKKIDVTSIQGPKASSIKRKQLSSPGAARKKSSVLDQPSTSKAAAARQNKFALLDQDDEEDCEMEVTANADDQQPAEKPKSRPPPIWCPDIKSVAKLQQVIDEVIDPKSYVIKPKRNNIGVLTNCSDDYRAVVKHLSKIGLQFHCYQLKEDKPYRVCVKGLHSSTDVDQIKSDICLKGHTVVNVFNPLSRIDKTPLNIFFVDLAQATNNKQVHDLRIIARQRCTVELPRKFNDLTQCHRCQEFGHTQRYCHKAPRCVRCAGQHSSKDCLRARDQPPICAHCEEQHPANYRGCLVYKRLLKAQAPAQKRNPAQTFNAAPRWADKGFLTLPTTVPTSGLTYAQAARGEKAQPASNKPDPAIIELLQQQQRQFDVINAEIKAMRELQAQQANVLTSLMALITKLSSK